MLVVYNLPPWLCLKDDNILLTLLIPGPRQPGNDIDIYLEPLVEGNVNVSLTKMRF